MSEESVCKECGFIQESIGDDDNCPFCGGSFVNLEDDAAMMDEKYNQEYSDEDEFGSGFDEMPESL